MSAQTEISYGFASDIGFQRSENQDAVGGYPPDGADSLPERGRLFVVADGMGGHLGGREASNVAVSAVAEYYFGAQERDPGARLHGAVVSANAAVFRRSREREDFRGMGTTCTAMAFVDGRGWLAHVGDSRAYRSDGERLVQLTTDHTHVEELVRLQLISRDEADHHPQRHVLTRSLGLQPEIEIDLHGPLDLHDGDRYLLCTDGLAGVELGAVHQTLLQLPAPEACARLVEMANAVGGTDNTTVLIVHVLRVPATNHQRRRWWTFGH